MKKILLGFVACLVLSTAVKAQDNTLTKKEIKQGWKLLFDGTDLKGWHSFNRDTVAANWIVKDGQIQYNREHNNAGDDLVTDGVYENYELQLQWRITPGVTAVLFLTYRKALNTMLLTKPVQRCRYWIILLLMTTKNKTTLQVAYTT